MSNTRIPPAHCAIRAFGGVRPLARALSVNQSSVSRWQLTGLIPTAQQRRVLEAAWLSRINLTAHDLIFGREQ